MAKRKLSAIPTKELQRELDHRRRELLARREELISELNELDAKAGSSGSSVSGGGGRAGRRRRGPGRPRGSVKRRKTVSKKATTRRRRRGGRRPRNEQSLVEAMQGVLQGQTLGVSQIADAVQEAGYKTSSANFRTIVNQALIQNTDKFKKVSRGRYTAA